MRQRLDVQCEMLQSLDGLGVAPKMYRRFESDGNSYVTMEHIDEQSLEDRARDHGIGSRLLIEEVLSIAVRGATALDVMHRRRLLFRDVTPSNLIIDGERVVFIDFGISHQTDGDVPLYGWGTPGYVAPDMGDEPSR